MDVFNYLVFLAYEDNFKWLMKNIKYKGFDEQKFEIYANFIITHMSLNFSLFFVFIKYGFESTN